MNYTWIVTVILFFALTHLVAEKVGKKREIGYGKTVLWSLLLTPIIAFLLLFQARKSMAINFTLNGYSAERKPATNSTFALWRGNCEYEQ